MLKDFAASLLAMLLSSCGQSQVLRSLSVDINDPSIRTNVNYESINSEPFSDKIDGSSLLGSLKNGGYIIYFRHATTEKDYSDQADPLMDLADCNSQRKLSLQGMRESHQIGIAFAINEIPVGRIIVSEYCRSWRTANLAFGQWTQKDSRLNFLPYENYTEDHLELMKKNVLPLLTKTPLPGTNTVIVGHDDIFEAATGIYPEPQGIAYILLPDGKDGFEIVANILPSEWGLL